MLTVRELRELMERFEAEGKGDCELCARNGGPLLNEWKEEKDAVGKVVITLEADMDWMDQD